MNRKTGLFVIVALAVSASALPQRAAQSQAAPSPPTQSSSEGQPPTQQHLGRGTEDDVAPRPAAPDDGRANEAGNPEARANPEARGGASPPTVSFEAADRDKDGKVNRSEASGVSGLDFARADSNGDSSLSRQEFQTAMVIARPRG